MDTYKKNCNLCNKYLYTLTFFNILTSSVSSVISVLCTVVVVEAFPTLACSPIFGTLLTDSSSSLLSDSKPSNSDCLYTINKFSNIFYFLNNKLIKIRKKTVGRKEMDE